MQREGELKMHKTRNSILCALLIASMIAVALTIRPGYAISSITLQSSMPLIDPSITVGTKFNVTAYVDTGTNVAAFQVDLKYDATVVNATRAWLPYSDPQYIFYGMSTAKPTPTIYPFGEAKIGDTTNPLTSLDFTTAKKLAIVEFKVQGIGATNISTNNVDTYLLDPDINEISVLKGAIRFDNRPPIQPATVYLDPFKVADPTLTPSHTFNVNIKIANATDLNGFQFKLSYDPTILNVNSASIGSLFPPSVIPAVNINNAIGLLTFGVSISPPAPVSGSGTLATVVFHVVGLGRSDLNLYDVALADHAGDPLPLNPIPNNPGSFNNVLMAKLYVDPPSILDPTLKPGSLVNVNITIDDVENMYGYQFKLGFDGALLTPIGFRVQRVQNEGNFTIQMSMDDVAGVVWVSVDYYFPAKPITTFTPAALVTLTFQVDGYGTSVLHLYDTSIVDQSDLPIPHETADGFIQTVIRDVAIISVVPVTSWAYPGWPVDIVVVAKNKGMMSENFDVKAFYENNLIGTIPVVGLAPGANTTLTFTWNTSGVPAGIYTIRAEASPVPYETNLGDNVLIDGSVEIRSIYRDVAVTSVISSRTWVYKGWEVNVTVTVKNLGNVSETFDVNATYDGNLIGTQTVVDLPPTNEISLIFTWDTSSVAYGNYTLAGKATIVPFEFNPVNNVYVDGVIQIRLLGDINGDGKVDIKDLAIAAKAFGSYVGSPTYNPDADVNQDGVIDIRDLAIIAKNFGKSV
jgi:hypothetical protein